MAEPNLNFVNFKVGTSAAYAALASKNSNTLYFLSDVKKIMRGDDDYTSSVIFADVLPTTGIVGKLYIVGNKASKYDGSAWVDVYDLDKKANLDGATFTGEVILAADPTKDLGAATKQYVDSKISANDSMRFKGTVGSNEGDTEASLPTDNVRCGDTYKVATAGTYAGVVCEVGDMIIALADRETGATNADWSVVQANIDGAVTGPTTSAAENIPVFDNATGKVIKDSGKKVGGAAIAETPSENTLATEAAVSALVESNKMVWTEI